MSDSFLDDFKDESATALEEVMRYVNVMQTLEHDIQSLEDQLKEKVLLYEEVSERTLPAMLAENGLDELKLANGKKLSVSEDVYVSVPKNDIGRKIVLKWLSDNGADDLIKENMIIEEPPEELKTFISMRGINYSQDRTVNTNSLKAWFKRKLGMARGSIQEIQLTDVPKEANLFVERRAKIR